MKKWLIIALVSLSFPMPVHAKLQVVATLPWIGSLASALGKEQVSVRVLVKPGQDPHEIEAKPSMVLAARKADILMYNGLDLEIGYLPLLIESSRNPGIQPGKAGNLDCSQFIAAIEKQQTGDRSMGDIHPLGNPHYHLSAENILHVARGMSQALAVLDPGHASSYRGHLAAFEVKWKEKQGAWARINLKRKRFVVYHRFFEYLARERGFEIVGYIEEKPGIPPSARALGRLAEGLKRLNPDAILMTSYEGKQAVEALSSRTGIKGLIVPHEVGVAPNIKDWFSLMDAVLESMQ